MNTRAGGSKVAAVMAQLYSETIAAGIAQPGAAGSPYGWSRSLRGAARGWLAGGGGGGGALRCSTRGGGAVRGSLRRARGCCGSLRGARPARRAARSGAARSAAGTCGAARRDRARSRARGESAAVAGARAPCCVAQLRRPIGHAPRSAAGGRCRARPPPRRCGARKSVAACSPSRGAGRSRALRSVARVGRASS